MSRTNTAADLPRSEKEPIRPQNAASAHIRTSTPRFSIYRLTFLPAVLMFVLWEVFARINVTLELFNPRFLPPPTMLIEEGWRLAQSGIILDSMISSTTRIVIGFIIGCAAALIAGVLIAKFKSVEYWFSPVLTLIGPIPALALLPLFIIWFGIGEFPKILLIAWTTFIPVLVYTLDGFKTVPSTLVRSALSLGATDRQVFIRVMLPAAIPHFLVGAQVSLGLSFSALIVSEMMGASSGLGYIIVDARNYFKMTNMFIAIILIGLEYSLFSWLLRLVERKALAWRKDGLRDAVQR